MLPDLESLRCFAAAATHPSFRAAAGAVALSPAAFGERIGQLEELVGAKLFLRSSRKVALTAEGRALLPNARRCLDEARACLETARAPDRKAPFQLTLASRFELGLSWLLPALDPLKRRRPERTLQLAFGSGPEILRQVQRGDADAAITSARFALAGVQYALLHEESYAFVASPKLLRKQPLRDAADARRSTLLEVSPDLPLFKYLLEALPRRERWDFRHVELLGTGEAVRRRVVDGAGVAVLPTHMVRDDLRTKRLVRLLPKLKLPGDWFRLVWRADNPAREELRQLADELAARPLR